MLNRKAAMFGKLSQLDHYKFTSLRAKRGNLLSKSGAMFGLDARIALAIFGALSVISGAALYSAIQEAKTQRYISLFTEVAKAVEAYYIDTGEMLNVSQANATVLDIADLVNDPGVKGWGGSYLDLTVEDTDDGTNLPTLRYEWGNDQATLGYDVIRVRSFSAGYFVQVQGINLKQAQGLSQAFNGHVPANLITGLTSADKMYFNNGYQGYYRLYIAKQ